MEWSSFKRLKNEVETITTNSAKYIPGESCFVVYVHDIVGDNSTYSVCKKLHKKLDIPSSYHNQEQIVLIYPLPKEGEHFMNGNQQRIVQFYTTLMSDYYDDFIIDIIEFPTRENEVLFIGYIILCRWRTALRDIGGVSEKSLNFKTDDECTQEITRDEWKNADNNVKYGTILRKTIKKGKTCLSKHSGTFDATKINEYVELLFGV